MQYVGSKNGFNVWFNTRTQVYSVYLWGKLLVTGKHKYSEVKTYIE